jgi:hypothetical protein
VLNLVGADLRVSIPAAGALVTAYAPGLGIGEPIDRADGWNLVAGVSLHRPRSVPPYVPDITARFGAWKGNSPKFAKDHPVAGCRPCRPALRFSCPNGHLETSEMGRL